METVKVEPVITPFLPLRSLQRRPQAPQLKSKFLAASQEIPLGDGRTLILEDS